MSANDKQPETRSAALRRRIAKEGASPPPEYIAQAEKTNRMALERMISRLGPDSPMLAMLHEAYADSLAMMNRDDEAEEHYRKASELKKK